MAVARVQTSTLAEGTGTNPTHAFAGAMTIGSVGFLAATNYKNNPAASISSITDDGASGGNTWQEAKQQLGYSGDSNKSRTMLWYAHITKVATTLTINFSGSCDYTVQAAEYSGLASSSLIDTTNSGEGRSTTPSAGAVTAATAGSLYLAVLGDNGDSTSSITPPAGWTQLGEVEGSGHNVHFSFIEFITSGSQTAAWTYVSTQDDWAAVVAIFKIAASAQPPRSMHQFRKRRNYAPSDREAKMFFEQQRKSHRVPNDEAQRYLINQREQLRRAA